MLPGIAARVSTVEPLGLLFALVASALWIVDLALLDRLHARQRRSAPDALLRLLRARARRDDGHRVRRQLLTLFLFYEALTLVTYPLVTHHGTEEARRGGRIYLGVLLSTSIVLLLRWRWSITWTRQGRSTSFRAASSPAGLGNAAIGGLLALFMFGIGKAALMPFHRWLPAAMVAPTPVSRAAARRRRGQGRRVLRRQGHRLRVRRRSIRGRERRLAAVRRRRSRSSRRRSSRCAPTT